METKKQTMDRQSVQKYTKELAHRINIFPEGGKILILEGEMGSGKTFFTKCFTEYFCEQEASSPSFSLVQVYQNNEKTVVHFDFQRIDSQEAKNIFSEYEALYPHAVFIIEWVFDDWKVFFKNQAIIHIKIFHTKDPTYRDWEVSFYNPFSIEIPKALQLQDEYITPMHIRRHIFMVQTVAVFCAKKLQEYNIPIDINLVEASALCHDIVKYVDFKTISIEDIDRYDEPLTEQKVFFWESMREKYKEVGHEKAMQHILQKKNWYATGKVVASHRSKAIYEVDSMSWEEKCLYYADKRCLHDGLVSLSHRLIDGAARYEKHRNLAFEAQVFALEIDIQQMGHWNDRELEEYCKKTAMPV